MSDFDNTAPVAVVLASAKWADVRFALTDGGTDPLTIANGSTVDGLTAATGNRFVCVGNRVDAGIYVVGASASTRATDANEASEFVAHRGVDVTAGTTDNVGRWILTTTGAITLGTTDLTFSKSIAFEEELPESSFDNTAAGAVTLSASGFNNAPPDGEVLLGPIPTGAILAEHGGPIMTESRVVILQD